MPDVHGSADITAEPNLQPRLVIARQALNSSDDTDLCASLSLSKTEQDLRLSSEVKDHTDIHVNSNIPTPSDNDDGRIATEDEVRDLLHVVDKIPVRLWVACLAGILERFVWYGATAPLRAWYILPIHNLIWLTLYTENYLQNAPGGEVPGALGLQQATASNIVNALIIGSYIVPVPAAVVADSWLGRYKTMIYSAMYCEVLVFLPCTFDLFDG
jgi:POT family proton-dependent oligopeptide transporter